MYQYANECVLKNIMKSVWHIVTNILIIHMYIKGSIQFICFYGIYTYTYIDLDPIMSPTPKIFKINPRWTIFIEIIYQLIENNAELCFLLIKCCGITWIFINLNWFLLKI